MLTSVADVREQRRDVERYGRSSAIPTPHPHELVSYILDLLRVTALRFFFLLAYYVANGSQQNENDAGQC